jgi:hypothetical protein
MVDSSPFVDSKYLSVFFLRPGLLNRWDLEMIRWWGTVGPMPPFTYNNAGSPAGIVSKFWGRARSPSAPFTVKRSR